MLRCRNAVGCLSLSLYAQRFSILTCAEHTHTHANLASFRWIKFVHSVSVTLSFQQVPYRCYEILYVFHQLFLFLQKTHHICCWTQSLLRDTATLMCTRRRRRIRAIDRQSIRWMGACGMRCRNCARATTLVLNNYIVHKLAGFAMYTMSALELLARECTILISPASSYMLVNCSYTLATVYTVYENVLGITHVRAI